MGSGFLQGWPCGWPTDVTDLAQERGRQHRPDPEQPDQVGLGLSDGGLDPLLEVGDPSIQVMHVGD